ncbi:MAG: dipeptidase [Lacipirellulaceae bacterium]
MNNSPGPHGVGILLSLSIAVAAGAAERGPIVVTDAARVLHESCLVIDGHNDMPWEIRQQGSSDFSKLDIAVSQPTLQTDLPRLREGGVGAQFWSVWVPAETAYDGSALATTLEQIELVKLMLRRYPDQMEYASTAADIRRIAAEGKIASLIGVEGGYSIEGSLGTLRRLYKLGARYMTLTHSDTIAWADSGTDEERHGGLTDFGKEVVREMNRLGMMIDISHVSINVMKQAIETSAAPVIFSHSSSRAIADHPRNVPDEVLRLLPENDGVVMVNFFSGFVVPAGADNYAQRFDLERKLREEAYDEAAIRGRLAEFSQKNPMPKGTIHDVLDHIDQIAKVAGARHVGLGSDFDGVSVLPEGLEDVACYPRITQGLLDRGYSPDEVRGILGENMLRVMEKVERVAEASAATGPSEE